MNRLVIARELEKRCAKEMYDIEMCGQCYERANNPHKVDDWFTEVCDPPHLLVWAKLSGHPYRPAKVIGITASNELDVRFFYDHKIAKVLPRDCFVYPSRNPNKRRLNAAVVEQLRSEIAVRVFIFLLPFGLLYTTIFNSLEFFHFSLKIGRRQIFG